MRPTTEALIIIDVQNDFCPGGALAVAGGDEIIPLINAMSGDFATVVLTQDWHPANHSSFAANHPGAAPYSVVDMPYGPQVLWPTHCVQGSPGAAVHPGLATDSAQMIIRKGFRTGIDSYSAFFENDHVTPTGLDGYLRSRGVTAVTFVGLATDFWVPIQRWMQHGWVTVCVWLQPRVGQLIWADPCCGRAQKQLRRALSG